MNYRDKYYKYKKKYLSLKSMKGQGHTKSMQTQSGFNINTALKDILESEDKSFIVADIELDKDERNLGTKLKVDKHQTYSYFGPIHKDQIEYISDFIQKLGNDKNISDKVANMYMAKVIKPFLDSLNKDYAWVTIRASKLPTDEFDLPRWHIDGYYYKVPEYIKKNKKLPKLVFTLKGPGSLLKETNKETREEFTILRRKLYKKLDYKDFPKNFDRKIEMDNRKQLNKFLNDNPSVTSNNDQIVIFITNLGIHSEPPIHEERLFMSILPGSKDDIKELADGWKRPFSEQTIQ
jgi:hypothetical protein